MMCMLCCTLNNIAQPNTSGGAAEFQGLMRLAVAAFDFSDDCAVGTTFFDQPLAIRGIIQAQSLSLWKPCQDVSLEVERQDCNLHSQDEGFEQVGIRVRCAVGVSFRCVGFTIEAFSFWVSFSTPDRSSRGCNRFEADQE